MQSSYFEPTDVCPESQELVEHSTITTIRCGKCKKLNPNFQVPATGSGSTPPKHVNDCSQKTQPLTGREIIVVEDESPSAKSETILPLIPPARRRALATAIPSLPDFKIGYAEAERQHVNQIVADRRPKTNFATPSPLVYFGLSIAHFEWDSNIVDDLGTWKSSNNQWSINENNRYLTYQDLLASILAQARDQSSRQPLTKFVNPELEEGQWCLGHTNPTKAPPRDIVPWKVPRLLSHVIDTDLYEQKAVAGPVPRKLVTLWLYWTSEQPTPDELAVDSPHKSKRGKTTKKGKKAEKPAGEEAEIKVKVEPQSIVSKRGRPVSAEVSISKRTVGAFTRGQAAKSPHVPVKVKEEDLDTDFVSVEEVLRGMDKHGENVREEIGDDAGVEVNNEF